MRTAFDRQWNTTCVCTFPGCNCDAHPRSTLCRDHISQRNRVWKAQHQRAQVDTKRDREWLLAQVEACARCGWVQELAWTPQAILVKAFVQNTGYEILYTQHGESRRLIGYHSELAVRNWKRRHHAR